MQMLSTNKRTVYLATPQELLCESYYRRLWMATRNISIPRRDWLDEIADTFRDFNGKVLYRSGKAFYTPLVDDIFGNDPDMRWLGYYLKPDSNNNLPQSKSRKIERMQMLDLYFKIKHPDIARHFGK